METSQRPHYIRIMTTPPETPPPKMTDTSRLPTKSISPLTPPVTPENHNGIISTSYTGSDSPAWIVFRAEPRATPWQETTPAPFTGKYTFQTLIGRGLWSNVHKAMSNPPSTNRPPTPPDTPSARAVTRSRPFAVKTANGAKSSGIVLHAEARVLTYLRHKRRSHEFLVSYHGFDFLKNAIVMDFIPSTLESYAERAAQQMRAQFTTRTMFNPVIGVPEWKHLAKVLIEGLIWLHEQGCVHGDIKPANILIQEETQEINENGSPILLPKFRPLYCDFSSARILVTGKEFSIPADLSNDAITPQYSAPEILAGYGNSDHSVVTSFASDVFSLATTLITAATGESPYSGACGPQMLSMARAGKPLEAARAGSNATRVMKKGLVENVILKALEGKPEVRLTAQQWLQEFEAVA